MRLLTVSLLLACLTAPASAQQGSVPRSSQMISLALMDTLVRIGEQDLAGLFTFIPAEQAPMAMADYLMHNPKTLKRFLKKVKKDFKETQAIVEWDKRVLLYMVGLNSAPQLPAGMERLPQKLSSMVNEYALKPAFPLGIIQQRRSAKG